MTVYRPREDSFLLQDHIEDLNLKDHDVLDMGTGSGIIAMKAAEKGAEVLAADINPEALQNAEKKAIEKELSDKIEFVRSDLFENIDRKFDLILFNPPYLPGNKGLGDEEIWRGGEKGIEVTRRFLESASKYLKDQGKILVVMSSRADYEPLIKDYDLEIIESKKIWFETLYLARSK